MGWDQLATLADTAYVDAHRPFLPVANGTHFNGNAGFTSTNLPQVRCRQVRKLLRVISGGADQLQVEWANIWTSTNSPAAGASAENPGPNAVTVRMSVEYPAGNPRIVAGSATYAAGTAYALLDQVNSAGLSYVCIQAGTGHTPATSPDYWRRVYRYPVRWTGDDGNGTIAFAVGDYRKSLPVALLEVAQAGDLIAVLGAFDTGSSSNRVPWPQGSGACNTAPFVDWVVDAAGGMPAVGAALPDTGVTNQANGNTTTANATDGATWMKAPFATAITGNIAVSRCVGLLGDSLISGSGGDIRDGEPCGIFPRALDGVSWWRIAQAGNRAGCYRPGNFPWQASVAKRCTTLITNLGMNDLTAGFDVATVKANMSLAWDAFAQLGLPLFAGFLTPLSISTDAWATLGNQARYTNGGVLPTTQFPGDDATYLTSVYGQVAMWISQDGAPVNDVAGTAVKVGQPGHPVVGLLDYRGVMADPASSWKWVPAYTIDGAHPGSAGAPVQAAYLRPQLDQVLMARQQPPVPHPAYSPIGVPPVANMDRSEAAVRSAVVGGSVMSVVGVSPGRFLYGVRAFSGTATAKAWTIMAGADPGKMKVIATGASPASADAWITMGFAAATWIPAGWLLAVVLATPAANAWAGVNAYTGAVHVSGTPAGMVMAGTSADTVALAGTVSLFNAAKFTPAVFRAYAEAF